MTGSCSIIDLGTKEFSGAQANLDAGAQPGLMGAEAVLDTFYYALNHRSLELIDAVWQPDALVQLNNPVGGMIRGAQQIHNLYERIVSGPITVRVSFGMAVAYCSPDMITFAGREHGTYVVDEQERALTIRTSRVFIFSVASGGWRQVHHHGSIDDAAMLTDYQAAIGSSA